MKAISGVYAILNTKDGNIYIGSSKDIDRRWITHSRLFSNGNGANSKLWAAVREFGAEAFELVLIEECPADPIQLDDLEHYYLHSLKPEYNFWLSARRADWRVKNASNQT